MSIWTHVSGLIRVDSLRFEKDADPTLDKIYEILGKQISYNEVWDEDIKSHIPCGSEGSIQYQVITNPDLSAIAAYILKFQKKNLKVLLKKYFEVIDQKKQHYVMNMFTKYT